jgi:hypothetical protein
MHLSLQSILYLRCRQNHIIFIHTSITWCLLTTIISLNQVDENHRDELIRSNDVNMMKGMTSIDNNE